MNMNNMNKIKCQIKNHQEKEIISVCQDKDCKNIRLCCYFCVSKIHQHHIGKLIEIDQFNSFIQQEANKQVQENSFNQNQVIQGLEQLCKLVDYLHKILKGKLEILKKQNFHEYIKGFGNIQQGTEHWNKILEGMLKYLEAENGSLVFKAQNELNEMEEKSIKFIRNAEESLQKTIQQFNLLNKVQQLQFQNNPILVHYENDVNYATISQDGQLIVSGSDDKTVKLYDVLSKTFKQTIPNDSPVYHLALSSQNQYLAFYDANYTIKLFDLRQSKVIWTQQEQIDEIKSMTFSQDNQYLLSGGNDKKLLIWSVNNNIKIYSFETDSFIETVIMSQDNKLVSCICQNGTIYIWDFQKKIKLIEKNNTHENGFNLCQSSDSSIFVSSGTDSFIKIWRFDQIQEKQNQLNLIKKIKTSNNFIQKVLLTPNDLYIIYICNQDGKIMVHERETGNLIQTLDFGVKTAQFAFISISNDMSTLVSSNNQDQVFQIWKNT